MKYLRQFAIILFISLLGELLCILIPLPIPASVYGLVLMLVALTTGMLKGTSGKGSSRFFDRNYAGYVYSGGGWASGFLACPAACMDSGCVDYTSYHNHCYGSNRPGSAENHKKRRKKEWKSFSLTPYFLEQLSSSVAYEVGLLLKKKFKLGNFKSSAFGSALRDGSAGGSVY